MKKHLTFIAIILGALSLSGCVENEGYSASNPDAVCDANGNSYPSEEIAELAGLERAEYGATFCQ